MRPRRPTGHANILARNPAPLSVCCLPPLIRVLAPAHPSPRPRPRCCDASLLRPFPRTVAATDPPVRSLTPVAAAAASLRCKAPAGQCKKPCTSPTRFPPCPHPLCRAPALVAPTAPRPCRARAPAPANKSNTLQRDWRLPRALLCEPIDWLWWSGVNSPPTHSPTHIQHALSAPRARASAPTVIHGGWPIFQTRTVRTAAPPCGPPAMRRATHARTPPPPPCSPAVSLRAAAPPQLA